jgi:hypothetical protein
MSRVKATTVHTITSTTGITCGVRTARSKVGSEEEASAAEGQRGGGRRRRVDQLQVGEQGEHMLHFAGAHAFKPEARVVHRAQHCRCVGKKEAMIR